MVCCGLRMPALALAMAIIPAACAPPPAGMASLAPEASLSGPANSGMATSTIPGMDRSSMAGSGMNHSRAPSMQGMDMAPAPRSR